MSNHDMNTQIAQLNTTYINLKNDLFIAMQTYKRDQGGRFTDAEIKTKLLKQLGINVILITVIMHIGYALITR